MKLTTLGVTTVLVALVGLLGSPAQAVRPAPRPASGSVLSPCRDLPQLPTASCGTLRVPRDRDHPGRGSTTVAFALMPRTDQSLPSLGAVAPNPGGPGSSTIDNSGRAYADGLAPVLDRRELLLMDTRGVGRSQPATCAALHGPDRVFYGLKRLRHAIGTCGSQLGARAGTYGTAAIADDLDAVRAAVGIDKLDLLGDSYGTLLMPVYAHRHPRHVRSIVLAGAYTANVDSTGAVSEQALRRAIRLVGRRTGAYSGRVVIRDLRALASRLRHRPTSLKVAYGGRVHRAPLNEWQLAATVFSVYSSTPDEVSQTALARAAAASRRGRMAPIKTMVRASLRRLADAYASGPGLVSDAANWATTCHDDQASFSLSDSIPRRSADLEAYIARESGSGYGIFSARAWMTRANYDAGACLRWPTDHTARTPLESGAKLPAVPVLVLSGDLDANTPSVASRQAAAQFPNARWVEVKGAGHTPTSSVSGVSLLLRFIATAR